MWLITSSVTDFCSYCLVRVELELNCAKICTFQSEFPLALTVPSVAFTSWNHHKGTFVCSGMKFGRKSGLHCVHLIYGWLENHLKEWSKATYHLHQYLLHMHLLLHCCQCQFDQGCDCRDSCHSGHQHHPCHSHTAVGCRWMDSCPAKMRKIKF